MDNNTDIKKLVEELKKEEIIEKDYSSLGLKFNPFPVAGLPRYPLPPLDDEVSEKISHFIRSTYTREEYGGLAIVGEYGMGKTHLMKYIQFLIDELTRHKEIDFTAVTCFIDRPEDTPQKVIHKVVEEIGLDNIRKYIWKILIDKFEEDKAFYEKFRPKGTLLLQSKEEWNNLFEEPVKSNYLEFLKRFRDVGGNFKKLQEHARDIIKEEIVRDSALADRYLNLILFAEEKEADVSWDILAGYISKKDVQRKEIMFLRSIVEILRRVGFKQLYVFIDEFEDIVLLKGARLTNYLLTLNTLINRERKWAVTVSLTGNTLKIIKEKSPPLYDRLTSYEVILRPLNDEKSKKLLINYLNLARERDEDSFSPFSEESIKEMFRISRGNYRSFILLAHNAIEVALNENKELIDKEIIERAKRLRHETETYDISG